MALVAGGTSPSEFRDASSALKYLKELQLKATEDSLVQMPMLLYCLDHEASAVVRQCIATGAGFYCTVMEEIALQLYMYGKVDRWLEEMWEWMVKFKDAICAIVSEPCSIGAKILGVKFLEICVLLFAPNMNASEVSCMKANGRNSNALCFSGHHPVLNATLQSLEAKKTLTLLLSVLHSAGAHSGSFVVVLINCLAAIAKNRPIYYSRILSVLLGLNANMQTVKVGHAVSIQYSLRSAFLGFLRSSSPAIIESRDKLLSSLRTMDLCEATREITRRMEKLVRNTDCGFRSVQLNKDNLPFAQVSMSEGLLSKRTSIRANDLITAINNMPDKMPMLNTSAAPAQAVSVSGQEYDQLISETSMKASSTDTDLRLDEKIPARIGALIAEGGSGSASLESLISSIRPELLADMVMANMKHLPEYSVRISGGYGRSLIYSEGKSAAPSKAVHPSTTKRPI